MSTSLPLHLAIALDDAGWHPACALEPAARRHDRTAGAWWAETVRETDRPSIAFVTIADRHHISEEPHLPLGSPARLDALLIASLVAPLTRHVGLVPSVATTITEPFLVSSQVATLDHVSRSRAGWDVDVWSDPRAGGYVGPRPVPAVQERFAEAAEYVEVVRRLWDSWDDDAEIRDPGSHRFLDRGRLHPITYRGRYLEIVGPSITPRPPQGQPLVTVRADEGAADAFGAAHADVVFVAATLQELPARLAAVDELAAAAPRAAPLLRFAEVAVFLDASEGDARRRRSRLDARAGSPPWRGLVYTGTAADLMPWLRELSALGCDGVRLHPASVLHDLPALTHELDSPAPEAVGEGPVPSLRERLGLSRPANRYAVSA